MDSADQIVLEESTELYEPTSVEILEYAEFLGIDCEREKDLLWIARAGLKASLPHGWKPCQVASTQQIYYFNFNTGESRWDHPCDEMYRQLFEAHKAKKSGVLLSHHINSITEQEDEGEIDDTHSERSSSSSSSNKNLVKSSVKYLQSARKSTLQFDRDLARKLESIDSQTASLKSLVAAIQPPPPSQSFSKLEALQTRLSKELLQEIDREKRQFESDLTSFEIIWDEQFKITRLTQPEIELFRKNIVAEEERETQLAKDAKTQQADLVLRQQMETAANLHGQQLAQKKEEFAKILDESNRKNKQLSNINQLPPIELQKMDEDHLNQLKEQSAPLDLQLNALNKKKAELLVKLELSPPVTISAKIEEKQKSISQLKTQLSEQLDEINRRRRLLHLSTEKENINPSQKNLQRLAAPSKSFSSSSSSSVERGDGQMTKPDILKHLLEDRDKFILTDTHLSCSSSVQSQLTQNILKLFDEKIRLLQQEIQLTAPAYRTINSSRISIIDDSKSCTSSHDIFELCDFTKIM